MTVKRFETRLDWVVCDIKDFLKDSDASNIEISIKDLKRLVKKGYDLCTNYFEEQCVTERITEVVTEWMKGIKEAA